MEAINAQEEIKVLKPRRQLFRFKDAWTDIWSGIKNWRVWLLLGWLDVKLRYRRSYLGPFWITISMAIMIYSMGFIYSKIFNVEMGGYFLYIASGMLSWVLLSTALLEMINCFVEASSFVLQVKMPYSVYVLRIITRNFIILAHNALAVVPLLLYFKVMPNVFLLLASLMIISISMFVFGMLFAIVGVRFRDVQQVLASILQVCFLVTPIMWKLDMIPEKYKIAVWANPFYHYVDLVRSSFLGNPIPMMALKGSLALAGVGLVLMFLVLARVRHRIAFWV